MVDLHIYPDHALRETCTPVERFDESLHSLLDAMRSLMYKNNGIGLAANQVGHLQRFFIADVSCMFSKDYVEEYGPATEADKKIIEFINPVIRQKKGHIIWSEGCLSLPTIFYDIERAAQIEITAQDRFGNPFMVEAKNILAVCCQHEYDHLDGHVFIDHVSQAKRQSALAKLKKIKSGLQKKSAGTR